jgi:tRNA wybutosine-synthesizing protein 1
MEEDCRLSERIIHEYRGLNLSNPPRFTWVATAGEALAAFDKKKFSEICRPHIKNAWTNIKKSLELLQSFKCPTVIRFTLAKKLNLEYPKNFAELIKMYNPTYIEPKAYMHVGFSRLRLNFSNMPTQKEILEFGNQMAKEIGYKIIDESPESRVVLLSHLEKAIKLS